MFANTQQVIHFAWVSTPGPGAQAAVLGCERVCRKEVRNTHVHRAQQVSKFRKCLGCETTREARHLSEGSATSQSVPGWVQGSHSKEARHLTGQYSLPESKRWQLICIFKNC